MILSLRQFLFSACACGCCSVAVAQDTSVQFFVFGPSLDEQPKVLMWEQMTPEQRAQLWPLLTHEQRLLRWRHMTQDERRIMRKNMTPVERKNLKRRFVIDRLPPEEAKNLKTRKMTPAERELLRRQVIEVHVEMRGGVPYNCNAPTDCRRARKQSGLDVQQLRQTVPAETKVAKPAATLTVPANPPAPASASESARVLTTP